MFNVHAADLLLMSQKTFCIQAITWIVVLFNAAIIEATLPGGCKSRNLSVTADDYLRLYIDGREITGLVNADDWQYPDTVELPCNARVIAIEANNTFQVGGILAYTDDDHIKTNSSWKCTNTSIRGWETVEFNDSSWKNAVLVIYHDAFPEGIGKTVREDARWIWTEGFEGQDVNVFCRRKLDIDECSFGQPINECDPSMGRCINILTKGYNCSCYHGYTNDGQHKCKDVDECLLGPTGNKCNVSNSGSCINIPGSYKCRCYQGFTNVGDQHCEVSSDNKTSLIFGVSLGVAILIVLVLIAALSIVCSRTSKRQVRKVVNKDTTRSYIIPSFGNNSSTNKPSPSPERTYAQLTLNTMHSTQNDNYEEIIE